MSVHLVVCAPPFRCSVWPVMCCASALARKYARPPHVVGSAGALVVGRVDQPLPTLRGHAVAEEPGVLDVARGDRIGPYPPGADFCGQSRGPRGKGRLRSSITVAGVLRADTAHGEDDAARPHAGQHGSDDGDRADDIQRIAVLPCLHDPLQLSAGGARRHQTAGGTGEDIQLGNLFGQ